MLLLAIEFEGHEETDADILGDTVSTKLIDAIGDTVLTIDGGNVIDMEGLGEIVIDTLGDTLAANDSDKVFDTLSV